MQTYRNLRNQINRENDQLKCDYFSRKIYANDGNINGMWNTISKLIGRRSEMTKIPYPDVGGKIVLDLKQTVENLND